MGRRQGRKTIDRVKYREFHKTANHFFEAAQAAMELDYWTAAGVLIIHSAIAYADALSIRMSGEKSAGEDHEDAIALLETIVAASQEKTRALNQLRRIIEEKTAVSYMGEIYSASQTKDLWKRLERFRLWAESMLSR
jgi:hypothetical protein